MRFNACCCCSYCCSRRICHLDRSVDIENMFLNYKTKSHSDEQTPSFSIPLVSLVTFIIIIQLSGSNCSGNNITTNEDLDTKLAAIQRREFSFKFPNKETSKDNNINKPLLDDQLDVNILAKLRNFSIQTHNVVTDDQYVLTIHRLINPFINTRLKSKGVIILQHGILCSSSFYLINSSPLFDRSKDCYKQQVLNNSDSSVITNNLAFTLSNLGYDVWLTNFRGNQYSRKHLKYQKSDPEYWNFTVDSLVNYDYKAYVNYILNYTKKHKYTFIGHSLGSTVGLGSLVAHNNTRVTSNLTCSILLSPVASTRFIRGNLIPLFKVATFIYGELSPFPGEIAAKNVFLKYLCTYLSSLCYWIAETLTGKTREIGNKNEKNIQSIRRGLNDRFTELDYDNYDSKIHQFIFRHVLNQSVSILMLKHIVQVHASGRLSQFDHGTKMNKQKYGTELPPAYDLRTINQPKLKIFLLSGPSDAISTDGEVNWIAEQIYDKVGHLEHSPIPVDQFNHLDLIVSLKTDKLVNRPIIEFIERNECF